MLHDELSELYKNDPEEFQIRCRAMIDEYIESVPEEKRQALRQLQWRIDGQLSKYKDPIARMNKMCELFWEGFAEFQQAMNGLTQKLN